MKTKLLFTKQRYVIYVLMLAFSLCVNYTSGQNLIQNGTCDDWTVNTSDNADAYDMTPNNTIVDNSGATITSPYQVIWDNDALEDWLEVFYLGGPGSLDEQPGSTSNGNGGTRGVKLYDDGSPAITGSSRRIYQKVEGLVIGNDYIFSVDSFSEAAGTPSEVYILNTEITGEDGINANGSSDASVDGFLSITTDFNAWTTSSFTFTATNTFAVVYIRSLNSIDGNTEVFYDNFSLIEDVTASVNDFLASNLRVYPIPAQDVINIESKTIKLSSVDMYNVLGAKVMSSEMLNNRINVSNLTKGLYFMKINAEEGGSATKKIVIE